MKSTRKISKKSLLLTSASLLLPSAASATVTDGHRYQGLHQIDEIRERLKQYDASSQTPVFNAAFTSEKGDCWLAWGNWGNWNNWPNWGNWNNWPNWGNY